MLDLLQFTANEAALNTSPSDGSTSDLPNVIYIKDNGIGSDKVVTDFILTLESRISDLENDDNCDCDDDVLSDIKKSIEAINNSISLTNDSIKTLYTKIEKLENNENNYDALEKRLETVEHTINGNDGKQGLNSAVLSMKEFFDNELILEIPAREIEYKLTKKSD
jgi:hypothetical protein